VRWFCSSLSDIRSPERKETAHQARLLSSIPLALGEVLQSELGRRGYQLTLGRNHRGQLRLREAPATLKAGQILVIAVWEEVAMTARTGMEEDLVA
jgi:hypothetical protein